MIAEAALTFLLEGGLKVLIIFHEGTTTAGRTLDDPLTENFKTITQVTQVANKKRLQVYVAVYKDNESPEYKKDLETKIRYETNTNGIHDFQAKVIFTPFP